LNPSAIYDLYSHWKQAYGKLYGSNEEDNLRFNIFQDNYLFIINYNQELVNGQPHGATMGLNEYADLTTSEFSALKQCLSVGTNANAVRNVTILSTEDLPASVDWRQNNAVTPIKNQQQCGSCWAFSTTGSLEGLNAINNNNLLSFSEQQLVDCSGSYGNEGCNGGLMDYAFQYVEATGITLEASYPYEAVDQTCQAFTPSFSNTGYTDVQQYDASQLQAAVAQQPTSIAIEADQQVFQFYTGGILDDQSCGTQLDHGVLVVGYATDATSGTPYWIVKNSWGSSWGENGYIRIANDNSDPQQAGICGINSDPSYPTL